MNLTNSFAFLTLTIYYCVTVTLLTSSNANASFVTLFDNSNNNQNFSIQNTNRTNEIKNSAANKTSFLAATSNLFQSFYEKLSKRIDNKKMFFWEI